MTTDPGTCRRWLVLVVPVSWQWSWYQGTAGTGLCYVLNLLRSYTRCARLFGGDLNAKRITKGCTMYYAVIIMAFETYHNDDSH